MQQDLFSDNLSPDEISALLESSQSDVKHYVLDIPVELLKSKYRGFDARVEGDVYIPKYQRAMKWDALQQSYFIESILLRLPCQPLFFCEIEGRFEIVDGSQRVRTIIRYLNNELTLCGLENIEFLNGTKFSDLPIWAARKFLNTPLRVFVVESSTDDTLQYELFRRINTFSQPLQDAEIRLGAFRGPFLDLVLECSESTVFSQLVSKGAVSGISSADKAFQHQELVTRFFIYVDNYKYFSHDVRRFIDKNFKNYNRIPDVGFFENLRSEFYRVMHFYKEHCPYIFRRSKNSSLVPRVRFEALAVGCALAFREKENLNTGFEWIHSDEFAKSIRTEASNSAPKLRSRVEFVRDRLTQDA